MKSKLLRWKDKPVAVGRKKQVLDVQVTVRRVTVKDPDEAAAALERWRDSQVMLLQLLDRYEAQEAASIQQCREPTQAVQDQQMDPRTTVLAGLGLNLGPDDLSFRDISIS